MKSTWYRAALVAVGTLGLGGAPAHAEFCRLALVLALDVSASVDEAEDRLQRGGLAAALQSPEVIRAVLAGPGRVALHAFEWSGNHHQSTLLEWTILDTGEDIAVAADAIRRSRRAWNDLPTSLGNALSQAVTALRRGPACDVRKIDVSGDGPNNHGFAPSDAYNAFDFRGVTVNGLAILGAGTDGEIDLAEYYASEVLHGPGAFLEIARDFEDFERAMRRKLERELTPPAMSGVQPARRGRRALGAG